MPNPETLRDLYGEDYFRRWISDTTAHDREVERFRTLFRLIGGDMPRGRLLSVGCGLGFELRAAEELGYSAEGLEWSPVAVEFATNVLGLRVHRGGIEELRTRRDTFEVITFWDVLEHLPRPDEALRIARDALVADGMIVVRAPNVSGLLPRVSLLLSPFLGEWRHPEPPAHLFDFSPITLAQLATRCGLGVRRFLTDHWPKEKLVQASRRPRATSLLSAILYPISKSLAMGNSMIATLYRANSKSLLPALT